MMTPEQLTAARELFEEQILTDEVEIVTVTRTQSADNGDFSEETTSSITAAQVQPLSSYDKHRAGYDRDCRAYIVSVPYDTELTMQDMIVWNEMTMSVTEIMGPDSDQILLDFNVVEVSNV